MASEISSLSHSEAKRYGALVREERRNKAANRRIGELKTFWKWLGDEVPNNPWAKVEKYGEEKFSKYVPLPEDVGKVLSKADIRQKSLLLFLLCTGARVGEAYQLEWGDVDFDQGILRLWTRKRNHGNREARTIPIPITLRELLENLTKTKDINTTHVFINPNTGEPYKRQQPAVRNMMRDLCEAAEVKHFRFHALRHYVARMLVEGGQTNLGDIQALYGHQNATTTDIYLKSLTGSPVGHIAPYIEEDVINKTMAATSKPTKDGL